MEFTKVRELAEPTFNKVRDILPGKSGYNIVMKVVTRTVLIDIQRLDGTRVAIADFIVGDDSGVIKMRLRNEKYIDMLQEGQTIITRNCKIPVVNGHMRMIVDAFGKIEISREKLVGEVAKDKDLSAAQYDNFSMKTGQTNNKNYDGKSRFNDGSSIHTYGTGFY